MFLALRGGDLSGRANFLSMTDSIQWYYYADAAPPAPPRAPCNDRTHAGAVFEDGRTFET